MLTCTIFDGVTHTLQAQSLQEAAVVASKLKSQMKNRPEDDAAFLPYHERRQMQISPGRLSDVISPEGEAFNERESYTGGNDRGGGGRGGGGGGVGYESDGFGYSDDGDATEIAFPNAGPRARNPTPKSLRGTLQLTVEERQWYDAKKWLAWRWSFELTRMVGIIFLIGKLIPSDGPIGALASSSWGTILIPWFLLDVIVVVGIILGWRKFHFRYFSEAASLSVYSIFLGFPLGTIQKICAIIFLENPDSTMQDSVFFGLLVTSFTIFLVLLLAWAAFGRCYGKTSQRVGATVVVLFVAVYLCFAFVSMLRIIWEAAPAGGGDTVIDAAKFPWSIVPANNVFETGVGFFIVLGGMFVTLQVDFFSCFLPADVHTTQVWEKSRKLPESIWITCITFFAAMALYQYDAHLRGGTYDTRDWWVVLPLVVGQLLLIVMLGVSSVLFIKSAPSKIWHIKKHVAAVDGFKKSDQNLLRNQRRLVSGLRPSTPQ